MRTLCVLMLALVSVPALAGQPGSQCYQTPTGQTICVPQYTPQIIYRQQMVPIQVAPPAAPIVQSPRTQLPVDPPLPDPPAVEPCPPCIQPVRGLVRALRCIRYRIDSRVGPYRSGSTCPPGGSYVNGSCGCGR